MPACLSLVTVYPKYLLTLTLNRGFNITLKTQFVDRTFVACAPSGVCTPVNDLQAALLLPCNPNDSTWLDWVVLLLQLGFLRVVVYLVLRHRTHPS